jgi:hypothetical protein
MSLVTNLRLVLLTFPLCGTLNSTWCGRARTSHVVGPTYADCATLSLVPSPTPLPVEVPLDEKSCRDS